jgi:hypothetical protein
MKQPAMITSLDNNIEGGPIALAFQYNPKELSFTRTVDWNPSRESLQQGDAIPTMDYRGVQPYTLTVNQILFDRYNERGSVQGEIEMLKRTVQPLVTPENPKADCLNLKRPPVVLFSVGFGFLFPGVVTSLTVKYTMFLPDGQPCRAMVNLKMKQVWVTIDQFTGGLTTGTGMALPSAQVNNAGQGNTQRVGNTATNIGAAPGVRY